MVAIEQILKKIENSQVVKEPFEHIIIDNLLPAPFYNKLSQELDNSLFCKQSYIKGNYGGSFRFAVDITDYSSWRSSKETMPTKIHQHNYNLLSSEANSGNIKLFFDLFIQNQESLYQTLCTKISSRKVQDNYFFHASVVQDSKGYSVSPHTDDEQNIFTILFYAPTTQQNKQFGLRMGKEMNVRIGPHQMPLNEYRNNQEIISWLAAEAGQDIKHCIKQPTTIDFVPNRMIIFAPTKPANNKIATWHEVKKVTEELVGTRNSFQMFYYKD
tara:strand:- start:1031 stop:1843 length:813 start_codon:yes stop_codon:yes gene_type:complete